MPWAIPLRRPLAAATGAVTHRHGFVVVLHGDDGACGIGEAAPHPAAPTSAAAVTGAALHDAATWLVGAHVDRLDALLARLASLDRAAASGLDMALHDLVGRVAGKPVSALLGGALRGHVETNLLLADDADLSDVGARGWRVAKLKAAGDLATTVARVAAVRAAAPSLHLRVDPNGAWTADEAIAAARALAPLEWLEQPTPAGDVAALARVRRVGGVPLAADEAVDGPDAIPPLAGAADVAILKLVHVGGLARGRATAEAAARAGMAVAVTTSLDTSIATAAALHLAVALRQPPRACGVATTHLLADDLVTRPLVDAPAMAPPAGPGLGVALDRAALARCRP